MQQALVPSPAAPMTHRVCASRVDLPAGEAKGGCYSRRPTKAFALPFQQLKAAAIQGSKSPVSPVDSRCIHHSLRSAKIAACCTTSCNSSLKTCCIQRCARPSGSWTAGCGLGRSCQQRIHASVRCPAWHPFCRDLDICAHAPPNLPQSRLHAKAQVRRRCAARGGGALLP